MPIWKGKLGGFLLGQIRLSHEQRDYLHRKVWIVALAMRKVSPETCLLVKQTVHTKFLCL